MAESLTIVSCGLGRQDLTPAHQTAVENADLLAGGRRLLDWFPEVRAERVLIGRGVQQTVDELIEEAGTRKVAVLASGDALFFGIARLFLERMNPPELRILPNITAAQAGCARIGIPWDNAKFFSAHGRTGNLPWRQIARAQTTVIYCDHVQPPSAIARELIEYWPRARQRRGVIAQDLGGEMDALIHGTLEQLADADSSSPALLVLRPCVDAVGAVPPASLGLDDDQYTHERNLITHSEVRSVALAKLRLRRGIMWDLGAGSGSVGIEAAGLCPGLEVFSVEKESARIDHIRTNAKAHGIRDLKAISGDILETVESLPAPEFVFCGGGGMNIAEIVRRSLDVLKPGGRLVATAVLQKTQAVLADLRPDKRVETLEIAVRRARKVESNQMMSPDNPVMMFVFEG